MTAENFSKKRKSIVDVLKKGITISGAVARSVVGLGATVLLFFAFRKKKTK